MVTEGPGDLLTIVDPNAPPPATFEPVEVGGHCEVAADGSSGHCSGYSGDKE